MGDLTNGAGGWYKMEGGNGRSGEGADGEARGCDAFREHEYGEDLERW